MGFVLEKIGFVLHNNVIISWQDRLDRGFGSAKIKVQSGKLRNPDLVGMDVLVVALFSISRARYLLDVYYTS